MDVSIIIVNYNTVDLTIQCVNSIYEKTCGVDFEIIIVDNASSDDSVIRIKKTFPLVTLIESKENLGFGRANNLGVLSAIGKYLFLLNSDTVLVNNAIKVLLDFVQTTPQKIGVCGGVLFDSCGEENGCFGIFPTVRSIFLNAMNAAKVTYTFDQKQSLKENGFCSVDYVIGADMFIAKRLYDNMHGFDPIFFMYYEETDLQKRIVKKGYENYVLSSAQIIHLVNASVNKLPSNDKRTIVNKSMLLYMKKHTLKSTYLSLKYSYLLLEILKSFRKRYSWNENIQYLKNLLAI